MKIGFDLDKVLVNYPPFVPARLFNKLYKKKDNGILLYRFPSHPEQLFRKAIHVPLLRPPIKQNISFLKNIPTDHNQLYLISSRFGFLKKETAVIMKKYNLDKVFDEVYFNFENKQPHLFKNDIIKKLKLDLYVDDDLSLLKYVAQHNANTKFFWLNDEKKNEQIEKNIFAISHLPNIFKE